MPTYLHAYICSYRSRCLHTLTVLGLHPTCQQALLLPFFFARHNWHQSPCKIVHFLWGELHEVHDRPLASSDVGAGLKNDGLNQIVAKRLVAPAIPERRRVTDKAAIACEGQAPAIAGNEPAAVSINFEPAAAAAA